MKPSAWKILEDEGTGQKYFKKVLGEESKNHKFNSEDMKNGGTINFETNSAGFNARLFFQLFMSKQHPSSKHLFNKAQRPKKTFKLHSNPSIWYEKNKIGKNEISKAVPELCKAIGCETRYKNNQLRPTAVRFLKLGGAEDREIVKFTGHKSISTLQHYDSGMEQDRQLNLSSSIGDGFNLKNKKKRSASIPDGFIGQTASISRGSDVPETSSKPASIDEEDDIFNEQMFTQMDEIASQHFENIAKWPRDEEDDDFNEEMLTQIDEIASQHFENVAKRPRVDDHASASISGTQGDFSPTQFLKNEQSMSMKQMELFSEQLRLMKEAGKMRYEFASKKCRK